MARQRLIKVTSWLREKLWIGAGIIGLLLGFLLGFIAFAKPSSGDVFSNQLLKTLFSVSGSAMRDSSWAEWGAAVGTLIVGFMAWRIARESHAHNVATSDANRERSREEDQATVRRLHYAVRRVHAGAEGLSPTLKDFKESRRELIVCFEVNGRSMAKLNFPHEAVPLLSKPDVEKLHVILATYDRWVAYCAMLLEKLKAAEVGEALGESETNELEFVIQKTDELATRARAFRVDLETILDRPEPAR